MQFKNIIYILSLHNSLSVLDTNGLNQPQFVLI